MALARVVVERPRAASCSGALAESIAIEAAVAHYEAHGYARLGRRIDAARLERLRARADALMLGQVRYPGLFFQKDTESGRYEDLEYRKGWQGPSLNYRKLEKLELDPEFLAMVQEPLFEQIARRVIEGPIAIYRAILFNKSAHGGTPLPWHQDAGRMWGLDRDPVLQIWTALDDAPMEAGGLEVAEGTHKDGLATPLGGMVPESMALERSARLRVVPLPASEGEVIVLHNLLWHRSGANATAMPRRTLSICYISAKTRCLRTRRAPRTFLTVFP